MVGYLPSVLGDLGFMPSSEEEKKVWFIQNLCLWAGSFPSSASSHEQGRAWPSSMAQTPLFIFLDPCSHFAVPVCHRRTLSGTGLISLLECGV